MADRYWVGGTGSWNSTSKWSASSGGSSGASVPTSSDNVIFDVNSGSAHYTVTVTSGATCANFTFTPKAINGATNFVFQGTLTVAGSFSTSGTQGNRRAVFYSSVTGTQRTLSIASIGSVSDVDFQDISVTGAGGTLSGTRIGNRGNCTSITFSTPKSVYWVTSSNANWSGDNWSASSGGSASTNSFPLPQDTAVFDSNFLPITANEVYIDDAMQNGLAIGSFLSSRTALFYIKVRSGQVQSAQVYGDWNNSGGAATFSGPSAYGYLEFVSSGTQTLFSAGPWPPIQVSCAPGGTVQLSRNFLSYSDINVAKGTFTTQNYDVSVNSLTSSNTDTRTINLGSSTVTLSSYIPISFATSTGLTFNAGTSTINLTNSASGASVHLGNQTFYNVNFTGTGTSTAHSINGANTFTNLSFSAPASTGLIPVSLIANQTITGTLTCSGATAIRRLFIFSSAYGTTRTLTVNSLSATDCDFRNITVAGSAAGSSQTRAGDCGGNNGITFDAPKTVYWNLSGSQNWGANGWASSSGGSPAVNNFPLAQDVAAFDNAGSAGTVTINYSWNVGSINASARTSAMTLAVGTATTYAILYKDLTLGTGLTINGSGLLGFQFLGQGITQSITCNGASVGCLIWIGDSSYPTSSSIRTVRFADAFSSSFSSGSGNSLYVYQGTLDTNSQNASFAGVVNFYTGTVATLGSSTITCNGGFSNTSAASVSGSGATIKMNSSFSSSFAGGGAVYSGITLDKSGSGTLNISGNNTFDNITNTQNLVGPSTITFGSGSTNTFLNWNASGAVGRLLTINASSSTNATISKASGTVSAYYLSISKSTATGGATWIAYDSVNGGGNIGWNFTALQGGMLVFFL